MIKKNYLLYGSLLLVFCGIARSTDLFFRIDSLNILKPANIIFWEHFITSILLIPLAIKFRNNFLKIPIRDFGLFIMIGVGASALGILFFTKAFEFMNPALVILLQKLQPMVTILLGYFILKEKIDKSFIYWAIVAVVASYFVSFSNTNPFSGHWNKLGIGVIYTLLAVFFWGSGTVWGKMLLNQYDKNFVLLTRFYIGTIFSFFLSIALYGNVGFHLITNKIFLNLTYMAIVPGLLATGFFYYGLKHVKTSYASMLELVFPLSSVIIMWKFFNQPLDRVQIIASVILIVSIMKITSKQKK